MVILPGTTVVGQPKSSVSCAKSARAGRYWGGGAPFGCAASHHFLSSSFHPLGGGTTAHSIR
ncbi:hypothetical protein QF048_007527 [Streptomyces sp. W4I9-2]|nr:hypothetical protein [Streptomyces sp. W4I9-2]